MKALGLISSVVFVATITLVASPAIARDTVTKAEVSTATTHDDGQVTTSHTTTERQANTNRPSSADHDTGLDRAEDRMSAEGLAHSQALKNHTSDSDEEHSTTTTTTSAHTH